MIANLSEFEMLHVCGNQNITVQTCRWRKSSSSGPIVVAVVSGTLAGCTGFATFMGAAGATFSDHKPAYIIGTMLSGIVMGTIGGLGSWFSSDCYHCDPNV